MQPPNFSLHGLSSETLIPPPSLASFNLPTWVLAVPLLLQAQSYLQALHMCSCQADLPPPQSGHG